jgi:hypothetical protein
MVLGARREGIHQKVDIAGWRSSRLTVTEAAVGILPGQTSENRECRFEAQQRGTQVQRSPHLAQSKSFAGYSDPEPRGIESEQERYRREMEAFEEERRQAQKEGYAYSLVPPTPPKQRRQPITPF